MDVNNSKKYEEGYLLGNLIVEKSHPVTRNLSEVTARDIKKGIKLLIKVDEDVLRKYKEVINSADFTKLASALLEAMVNKNRVFLYGCGSTGRLSILVGSMWRNFWRMIKKDKGLMKKIPDLENLVCSLMTGGDYALIKSVERYEDYIDLGKYQIEKEGVRKNDVVIGLTGTGETATIVGAVLKGVEKKAKVFFIYGVPEDDNILKIKRARDVLLNENIDKVNITTGHMAILGSTRMQSSTMQQITISSALEIALSKYLSLYLDKSEIEKLGVQTWSINDNLINSFNKIFNSLKSNYTIDEISRLASFEEDIYSSNKIVSYLARDIMLDVFTDTTERNPTFSIPPFRKKDEKNAAPSWAYVINPFNEGEDAWEELLNRKLNCLELDKNIIDKISEDKDFKKTQIVDCSKAEVLKFQIGLEALKYRKIVDGNGVIAILYGDEKIYLMQENTIILKILRQAAEGGGKTGLLFFGSKEEIKNFKDKILIDDMDEIILIEEAGDRTLLKIWKHILVKMVLNIFSTITMVRLKRVEGNFMVCLLPTNKKLYDRGARIIQEITGADYEIAYKTLLEVMDYLQPRIDNGEFIIPPVLLAINRIKNSLTNNEAERLYIDNNMT